jgi:small glutamine-rich tetratricopeptide repeat-containing protein alpha
MSDISANATKYAVVQYLTGLKGTDGINGDKLQEAISALQEVFGMNMESVDDFKTNSLCPYELHDLVVAGCKASNVEPYAQALSNAQSNPKFEPFVETVSKKGYFKDVEEGSMEYLQRHAKVMMKFREKVTAKGPNNEAAAEVKKQEGNSAIASKDYKGAIAAYSEAIDLSPSGPNTHIYYTNRAAAHCYLKNYEASTKDCAKAISLDPLYVKAYSRLGLSYFFMENYGEAVTAYQKAVDLEPETKSLKDSLRQAKQKLDAKSAVASSSSGGTSSSSGAGGLPGMPAGMPDMAALQSMMGGEGGLAALMKNPAVMNAAQEMMKNPAMMQQAMSMMGGMGGAGGAGGAPDMAAMAAMMQGMNAGNADNNKGGKKKK